MKPRKGPSNRRQKLNDNDISLYQLMAIVGAILFCVLCLRCLTGCGAQPKANLGTVGEGAEIEIEQEAQSNNPWPWMIATMAMPVLFLLYLFLDKRYLRFGFK